MAYQPAILSLARLANLRLGYVPAAYVTRRQTRVRIILNNVFVNIRVKIGSVTIHDILNDAPNTCSFAIRGTAPTVGQFVRVSINSDTPTVLFSGTVQTVETSYDGHPAEVVSHCSAIDTTVLANRKLPFGTWVNVSATTVAEELIAQFAPGFTTNGVQASLPSVSVIFDGSEGMNGCLTQLAKLVGGYFYFDEFDLHLFQTSEATDLPDDIDDTPGRFLNDPHIHAVIDDSQLRTRVYGKGHGESVLSDVAAGETIVPIADSVMFNPFGGRGIAGTTVDGAQSQRISYTGIQAGGAGSLVGPGAAPSSAPTVNLATGAGLGTGVYTYAYTDITGSGETLPSPLASLSVGSVIADPTVAASAGFSNLNATTPIYPFSHGDAIRSWAYTFVTAGGETLPSPLFYPPGTYPIAGAGPFYAFLYNIPTGPSTATSRNIYRTAAGGSQLKLVGTIANNTDTFYDDHIFDGALGANVPSSNTASAGNQVALAGIAVGVSPTTSRKIYRTAVGASQLKLLHTIADNTTTTYTDSTADGSLGANAPTSDTSGIAFAGGQVNAGSTTILTASPVLFPASGWAMVGGGQTVRYTGITGNSLTGVPASGAGSLLTTILYGSQILPAPALTGVSGLALDMQKGARVLVFVQRDDTSAQWVQAFAEYINGRTSDGVYEFLVSDERRGEESLTALCDANLAAYSTPLVTVTYATLDSKSKSGKPVVVNIASPPISQTLTIQSVEISQIDVSPVGKAPTFTVTASTARFSLDDLLRRMSALLGGQ